MAEDGGPLSASDRNRAASVARDRQAAVATAALRLGFLLVVLALWWAAARSAPSGLFASPAAVAAALFRLAAEGRLLPALGESLSIYVSGTGAAIVFGIALGALMGTVRPVGRMLDVYVHALAATPRVAFIPLIIVHARPRLPGQGAGRVPRRGDAGHPQRLRRRPRRRPRPRRDGARHRRLARAASCSTSCCRARCRSSSPASASARRSGSSTPWSPSSTPRSRGLGGLLAIYGSRFQMAEYLAVVVVLALIGVTMTEGLRVIETRLLRWRGAPA